MLERKLGQFFLYVDLKIGNNLTLSWKKSGQQTAFKYTSGKRLWCMEDPPSVIYNAIVFDLNSSIIGTIVAIFRRSINDESKMMV